MNIKKLNILLSFTLLQVTYNPIHGSKIFGQSQQWTSKEST